MITGINHVTLSVRNIDQSFAFYTHTLGFTPVAKWPKGAYVLAGNLWVALVLDSHTRAIPLPEYTHIAFTVSQEHFQLLGDRIRATEAVIWQDNWTEGDSLYFVDPNGHKLEIHTSDLATRLQTARRDPCEGLQFFGDA